MEHESQLLGVICPTGVWYIQGFAALDPPHLIPGTRITRLTVALCIFLLLDVCLAAARYHMQSSYMFRKFVRRELPQDSKNRVCWGWRWLIV